MRRSLPLALLLAGSIARAEAPARDELSRAAAAQLVRTRRGLTLAQRKVDTRLRPLAWPGGAAARHSPLMPANGISSGPALRLYVRLASMDAPALARLTEAGAQVEIIDPAGQRIQVVADGRRLRALAELRGVLAIRPAERGRHAAGSVTSEGDAASHADVLRTEGHDGTGIVVGIISDGIDHAGNAQATGDLPAVMVPVDPRCGAGAGDEGTALLEIVHDLAPGAQLLFASGITSSLSFIDTVDCLVAAGAHVIADDLIFFDEPFFADGPVATAVRAAVQRGVSYHTAAGNQAEEHVEQAYRASPTTSFHNFLISQVNVDNTDDMTVPAGGTLTCILQWNDPFGASANDYDLLLYDAAMNLVAASTNFQSGTQDPLEVVQVVNNSGSPQIAKLAISKFAGADRTLEMFCLGGLAQQYVTPGSIFGHAAVPEVVAVAAIKVDDPGLDDVEPFSSRGPASLSFPLATARAKPDIAAFDGVSITNAGGFPACPPFCRFFGTSAATPHSAAVAALLLGKNGALTPAGIAAALRAGAVDIGPPGFDFAAGFGRLDAVRAEALMCLTSATCDDANACTLDACSGGICTHQVTPCDDGDTCNGQERCDPASGCQPGTPLTCVDTDPCTTDGCNPASGCVFPELPGLEWVACALDLRLRPLLPLPAQAASARAAKTARRLLARLAAAERHVSRAAGAPPRRARKQLAKAARAVDATGRLARRRAADLGATLVQAVVLETDGLASRIRTIRQTL